MTIWDMKGGEIHQHTLMRKIAVETSEQRTNKNEHWLKPN